MASLVFRTVSFGFPALAAVLALGCDVYDTSLLTGGSGGNPTTSTTGGAGGTGSGAGGVGGMHMDGGGGSAMCTMPNDCPGMDDECKTRTCDGGTCGIDPTASGFVVAQQTVGDCIERRCDGAGNIVGEVDDNDIENDNNDCTTDSCDGGTPMHVNKTLHTSCTGTAPAKVCSAEGTCVECTQSSDCTSSICTAGNTCAPASCGDMTINGMESDTDCGGTCTGCIIGKKCNSAADCLSNACGGGPPTVCQPSCTDTIQNQDETDVDCGGTNCPKCKFGEGCDVASDCETNSCNGITCGCQVTDGSLLLSEVKWRGAGGGTDEFVELYNPGSVSVTLTSAWTVEWRSETSGSYGVRFTGSNQVVPSHGHFLITGSGTTGGDATLTSGISDEGSVVLKNGGALVDAFCWNCGANTFSTHSCEGGQITLTGCANSVDRSVERKPGGMQGNCIDTDMVNSDWAELTPSNPQNLLSTPTP
ncbi:MAG: lamin tail domain-containing protein [Polyangiaceae bacterium]